MGSGRDRSRSGAERKCLEAARACPANRVHAGFRDSLSQPTQQGKSVSIPPAVFCDSQVGADVSNAPLDDDVGHVPFKPVTQFAVTGGAGDQLANPVIVFHILAEE